MIRSLPEFLSIASGMRSYLEAKGTPFDENGFPVLNKSSFLNEWPDVFVDYSHRNGELVRDKSKTVLCFFRDDVANYRRFERVFDDLPTYREYMGVVETDITVTADMDPEWQACIMCANALFMAVLAVNGVRVIPSTRCGAASTSAFLGSVPHDVLWVSSSLGCAPLTNDADTRYLEKILRLRPSKLALYGKRDPAAEDQLSRMGVNWRAYSDVHSLYKKRASSSGGHGKS